MPRCQRQVFKPASHAAIGLSKKPPRLGLTYFELDALVEKGSLLAHAVPLTPKHRFESCRAGMSRGL